MKSISLLNIPFLRTIVLTPAMGLFILMSPTLQGADVEHSEKGDVSKPKPVYSVSEYNPDRDPKKDLKMTIEQAAKDNKRILIQVGGEWCGWCHIMNDYFHKNEQVAEKLAREFIIMKVNYSSENRNSDFLDQYPEVGGYPHLYVLDSDGQLLHSQDTVELEKGKGYSDEAMMAFLNKWAKP